MPPWSALSPRSQKSQIAAEDRGGALDARASISARDFKDSIPHALSIILFGIMTEQRQYTAENLDMVVHGALGQAAMDPDPCEICIDPRIIVLGVTPSVDRFFC
jgi:hypothetical protein